MSKQAVFKRNKLSCAILSTLTATAISTPANAQIEEIIVTATKRAESTQGHSGIGLRPCRVRTSRNCASAPSMIT